MEEILYPGGRFNYSKKYTSSIFEPAAQYAEKDDLVNTYTNKYGIIKSILKYPSIVIVENNTEVTICAAEIYRLYKK